MDPCIFSIRPSVHLSVRLAVRPFPLRIKFVSSNIDITNLNISDPITLSLLASIILNLLARFSALYPLFYTGGLTNKPPIKSWLTAENLSVLHTCACTEAYTHALRIDAKDTILSVYGKSENNSGQCIHCSFFKPPSMCVDEPVTLIKSKDCTQLKLPTIQHRKRTKKYPDSSCRATRVMK